LPIFILTLSLNTVLAYGGSFNNFSFGGLFSSFNISMYLTALLFITIFAIIHFALGRTPFAENSAVRGIISLTVSAFSIWGIMSSGFSFEDVIYKLGITQEILPTILWMIAVIIALIILIRKGLRNFFSILFGLLGAILITLSFIGVIYQEGAGIVIGLGFLFLALIIHRKTASYIGGKSLDGAKWIGGKFPRRELLNSRKKIIKEIKKLEKGSSRAIRKDELKEAKDMEDQIKYLRERLREINQKIVSKSPKINLKNQKTSASRGKWNNPRWKDSFIDD